MSQLNRGVRGASAVRRLYDRVATFYDALVAPYEWIGGRRLAVRAIGELNLRPGDTVVDLGTGTGWNVPHLARAVGRTGTVIGVDLSPAMLQRARQRVDRSELTATVELMHADISNYEPPADTKAIISTFAIEMLPDYTDVIARLTTDLPDEGRIAVTGMRNPNRWPQWLIRIGSLLMRPFGVNEDYRDFRPWEAIEANTTDTTYAEAFGGVIYLAAGTRAPDH